MSDTLARIRGLVRSEKLVVSTHALTEIEADGIMVPSRWSDDFLPRKRI
ncbi:hypothetical protein LH400_01945 [Aurantimonas sp. VKM B-3413]|nr:hypothetical protein [Aurantimonas sp. VKM B-3413]